MAIHFLDAAIVGRSKRGNTVGRAAHHTTKSAVRKGGSSAIEKAAYNAREGLLDEKTGERHDYSHKFGGAGSEILLPVGSQPWMGNRQRLWNAIERIEDRVNSQLAKDFIINLPYELTADQRRAAMREFLTTEFVSKGFVVDVGYHDYGDPWPANSPIIKDKIAEWKAKGLAFYERKDIPPYDTGPHVAIVRDKQGEIEGYAVYQPHAHALIPFRTVDPDYKTGFAKLKERPEGDGAQHPKEFWVSELVRRRELWATVANKHLEMAGSEARISHLSLEAQGIQRVPEPRLGPLAARMLKEGKGDESHAVREWKEVKERNNKIMELTARKARNNEIIVNLEKLEAQRNNPMAKDDPIEVLTKKREIGEKERDYESSIIDASKVAGWAKEESDRLDRQVQYDRANAEEEKKKEIAAKVEDADIQSPRQRYLEALGEHRGSLNTFDILLNAARIEADKISREHDNLTRAAMNPKISVEQKIDILLVRDIQHAEYMADVSERIAKMNRFTEGRVPRREYDEDGEPIKLRSELQREQAQRWQEEAERLRMELRERRDLQADSEMSKISDHIDKLQVDKREGRTGLPQERYQPLNSQHDRVNDLEERRADIERRYQQPTADGGTRAEEQRDGAGAWRPTDANEVHQPGAHFRTDPNRGTEVWEPAQTQSDTRTAFVDAAREERRLTDPRHEITDRQQSTTAENIEITDQMAAKMAAVNQMGITAEQAAMENAGRSRGNSL